jgi:hypothetical protein
MTLTFACERALFTNRTTATSFVVNTLQTKTLAMVTGTTDRTYKTSRILGQTTITIANAMFTRTAVTVYLNLKKLSNLFHLLLC